MKFKPVGLAVLFLLGFQSSVFPADVSPMTLACAVESDPQTCQSQQSQLSSAPPEDGKITISNNTGDVIYKIFAWPTNLNPRTFNILGFPLFSGATTEIAVDNAYGDCDFSFQYDRNAPVKTRKLNYHVKPLTSIESNICGGRTFVWLGPIPDGKSQGKP